MQNTFLQKEDSSGFPHSSVIGLIADELSVERWETDEISDKLFRRILGRKSSRPIDANTEKELFIKYRNGDLDARNALVYANLRLVNSVARRFRPQRLTCNDVLAEGIVGLLKAIDGYDVNSYYRFSTYAYKCIYNHIRSFLSSFGSTIVIPSTIHSLKSRYIAFQKLYYQDNFCYPSDDEVADALNISQIQAAGIRQSFEPPVSIEQLRNYIGIDNFSQFFDSIIDSEPDSFDTSLNYESLCYDIEESLSNLYKREAEILRMNFGIGCEALSLDEIGLKFDLSRERTRQIREKAIRKLKYRCKENLRQYIGIENFD